MTERAETTFELEQQYIYQWFAYYLQEGDRTPDEEAAAKHLLERISGELLNKTVDYPTKID